jgi:hypothetical protein
VSCRASTFSGFWRFEIVIITLPDDTRRLKGNSDNEAGSHSVQLQADTLPAHGSGREANRRLAGIAKRFPSAIALDEVARKADGSRTRCEY